MGGLSAESSSGKLVVWNFSQTVVVCQDWEELL